MQSPKRFFAIPLLGLLALLPACGTGLSLGDETSAPSATQDTTSPGAGTFATSTSIDYTSFTLNWTRASDNASSQSQLQYFVCTANSAAEIDTITECQNATVAMNWSTDTITVGVTGKEDTTNYYFNVLVKDEAGNIAIYPGITQRTRNAFLSTWKTDNVSAGSSNNNRVALPLEASGNYNFTVFWGDGSSDVITAWNQPEVTHTYATIGTYNVKIRGTISGFTFGGSGDREKILLISYWGPLNLGNSGAYFQQASNLQIEAEDILDLTGTTDLNRMFDRCASLTTVPNMGLWDVSLVTDMSHLFNEATLFNQDIGAWDTHSVTNMSSMFYAANAFDQDIGDWDVSSVTSLNRTFEQATHFNSPLGDWDVSQVTNMEALFTDSAFNQDISGWMTSSCTYMGAMFARTPFNGDLSSWDTSQVTEMGSMFYQNTHFNQPINSWNTGSLLSMGYMFFQATAFNQSVAGLDVSHVTNMDSLFDGASSFDQSLSTWDISNVTSMSEILDETPLSQANYDDTLIGWAGLTVQNNVSMRATSYYSAGAATTARDLLINTFSWTIDDLGQN